MGGAALPRGGKGRCGCAYSTLFAPAGRRRFRVGAPDFGVSRRKGVCGAVCPSRAVWQARREAENGAAPPHSRRVPANVATAFAYPAQTAPPGPLFPLAIPRGDRRALPAPAQGSRPLRIPFWGNGGHRPHHPVPRSQNAAGGKSLLVDLPPSVRTFATFGTKRSAQAPCSWGLGASISSRRLWLPAPPATVSRHCRRRPTAPAALLPLRSRPRPRR